MRRVLRWLKWLRGGGSARGQVGESAHRSQVSAAEVAELRTRLEESGLGQPLVVQLREHADDLPPGDPLLVTAADLLREWGLYLQDCSRFSALIPSSWESLELSSEIRSLLRRAASGEAVAGVAHARVRVVRAAEEVVSRQEEELAALARQMAVLTPGESVSFVDDGPASLEARVVRLRALLVEKASELLNASGVTVDRASAAQLAASGAEDYRRWQTSARRSVSFLVGRAESLRRLRPGT